MNDEDASKKKRIILIIVAAVILLLGIILFFLWRSKITATTMRILRIEGTVTLEDNGKEKTITNNLRLNSGNALTTALKSLVSIGLDDTKIVTLDEKSRAEFNQSGRKIELNLTAGSLFFEVQKPLDNDESFDISTSTMVVGIRGTSGWVSVDGEHESLIVTDGVVHVIGTNPVTGEVKEIDVKAGQRINVYLYNDRKIDSIMFELVEITERDLPEFVLERLRENRPLLEKVCRETGWDKPWILGMKEEDIPKVVLNSGDEDDNGGSENRTDTGDTDTLLPDTGEETDTETKGHDRDTILTQEELDWAHSHVAIVDPATGIFALKDMTLFDPAFYAATNPDVVAKYGTDPDAMLWHYLQRGKKEGRPPIAPPTPTPTIIPTWGIMGGGDSDEDSRDSDDDSLTKSNGGTNQTFNIATNGGTATFGGQYGKGAKAVLNYTPGTGGSMRVTSPDSNDPTTVTVPASVTVTNNGTNYGFSPNLSSNNVELDFSQPAMANVRTLDLSAATATTGGWVSGSDMISYMENNNYINHLDEVKGPASTLTRVTHGTSGYNADVKTGQGGLYNQSIRDVKEYVDDMSSASPKIQKITYPGSTSSTGNPQLVITNGAGGPTTKLTSGTPPTERDYTNVQVDSTSTPYTITGKNSGITYTLGTIDSDGFTMDSSLP